MNKKMSVDDYVQNVIKVGDEGSELLRAVTASTLKNNSFVDVSGNRLQIPVLRFPENSSIGVFSSVGVGNGPREKARDLVKRVVDKVKTYSLGTPVAIANIIDSRTGDVQMLREAAEGLSEAATEYNIAILNGENAILGERVIGDMNISGTVVSLLDRPEKESYSHDHAIFSAGGKPVYMNCDGVGTKVEFYERLGDFSSAVDDLLAMNLDDTIKFGADARVVSGVLELNRVNPFVATGLSGRMINRCSDMGIFGTLDDHVGGVQSYRSDKLAFNMGATTVSTIDETRLNNPLVPNPGDYLVAIRGKPNPRSNGISSKREKMVELFGKEWHKTPEGEIFMEFLGSPSTVLYPVFKELINQELATGVYHMSGGAYEGKLARPLSKEGFFVDIVDQFPPDWREVQLASYGTAHDAYSKFPMGNDGFVATDNPERTIDVIQNTGLEARTVGTVKREKHHTGVRLVAHNSEMISYSGK